MTHLINMVTAAETLGVSRSFLYKLTAKKEIQHVKLGARVFFRPEDLEAFINAQVVGVVK